MIRCSILIPAYNNTVEQKMALIESINKQTAINQIKVLIVDDGSQEQLKWTTDFLIQNLKCKFQLYSFPDNCGIGMRRQFLFNQVTTEYFITIDSDDAFASATIIKDSIYCLDTNKHYDYVKSWVQDYQGKIQKQDISFHGFFARSAIFQKYNLFIPHTQYGEDCIFFYLTNIYNLQFTTLEQIGYLRNTGYLTNYICWPIQDLNYMNDIYNILRNFQFLSNLTSEQIKYQFHIILSYLKDLDSHLQHFQYFSNYTEMQYWEIYYYITSLSLFSTSTLSQIKIYFQKYNICSNIINYINQILSVNYITDIKYKINSQEVNYNELEQYCQQWIHHFYINFKPSHNNTFPVQILKNFPWCYKTLVWNSKIS